MKVLMLNGSPHAKGAGNRALQEMQAVFAQEGIETELMHVGSKDISSCIACNRCSVRVRRRGQ